MFHYNVIQSKYHDIDKLQILKIPNKQNSLSLFHINSCSLNKNFEELQNLLQSTNINFDVTAITETRIPKMFLQLKILYYITITFNILLLNLQQEAHFYK